jgi:hypothetical protein
MESYNDIMASTQAHKGYYTSIMPDGYNAMFNVLGSGWADAGIIIPWTLWQYTGDLSVVKANFAAMDAYSDYVMSNGYNAARFGDWLAFYGTSLQYMNDVYQLYTVQLMSQMAEAIGNSSAKAKYDARFASLKATAISKWVDSSGNLLTSTDGAGGAGTATGFPPGPIVDNSQTGLLWALKLGLYNSDSTHQTLLNSLLTNLANAGGSMRPGYAENTLAVGFLGVNVLLPVLADEGENEMAFNLLLQDEMPSWLFPVKQGATTTWERWNSYSLTDSFGDSGMNSFNHYSYGAAVEWVYKYLAGINIDSDNPGFENVILQPTLDTSGRITTVDAKYESVRGPIVSKYAAASGAFTSYHTEIPANTTATLYLPLTDANAKLQVQTGVTYNGIVTYHNEQLAKFTLVSGKYDFDLTLTPRPDITKLQQTVDQADALASSKSLFTDASWKAVADAVAKAKAVLATSKPSVAQVAAAQAALDKALAGLVAKPEPKDPVEPGKQVIATKVKFGQSALTLIKGQKFHLRAAVYYTKGSPTYTAGVTYKSSNTKVATVDKYGKITAKAAGKAKITATTIAKNAGGKKLSASYTVTVAKKKSKAKVKKVTLPQIPSTLKVGQVVYLTGAYTAGTQSVRVTYSTVKYRVATIDTAGRLLGLSKGKETVVVKAGGKTKKYTVTVK